MPPTIRTTERQRIDILVEEINKGHDWFSMTDLKNMLGFTQNKNARKFALKLCRAYPGTFKYQTGLKKTHSAHLHIIKKQF
ncbi:hypothetical protein MmiEs2_09010 [Methanimicrococcus stummii]|uniref:Uncharacterized protein n=1 Tax=Methanimicrococcus stummii TaxID=3028294 RepID=A0AA96VB79_9EURY|nr:hypothetical protein [Methanimicrococcus sp. Es2]WNY28698.1 hypothetical protein MmiEs2_09010 [Methanimicrococcus sp. Es2]